MICCGLSSLTAKGGGKCLAKKYGVSSIPAMWLVDKRENFLSKYQELEKLVDYFQNYLT